MTNQNTVLIVFIIAAIILLVMAPNISTLICILVIFCLLSIFFPALFNFNENFQNANEHLSSQTGNNFDQILGSDPMMNNQQRWISPPPQPSPKGHKFNEETLIYDNITGTIMSGSDMMDNIQLVSPPWISPEWNSSDTYTPSINNENYIESVNYENDPGMIYNNCGV